MKRHARRMHVDVTPLERVWVTLCGRTVRHVDLLGFRCKLIPRGHPVTCRTCLRLRRRVKARA